MFCHISPTPHTIPHVQSSWVAYPSGSHPHEFIQKFPLFSIPLSLFSWLLHLSSFQSSAHFVSSSTIFFVVSNCFVDGPFIFLPYSVHQEVLTWSSLLQRLWMVSYQQWCPSFLVDCCVFLAALGKRTRKMVSVLGQFCVKIGEIQRTYIVFYTKISSLPLTLSDDQGSERPELAGSKMARLFLSVREKQRD